MNSNNSWNWYLQLIYAVKGMQMKDDNLNKMLEELKIHFFFKSTESVINFKYFLDQTTEPLKRSIKELMLLGPLFHCKSYQSLQTKRSTPMLFILRWKEDMEKIYLWCIPQHILILRLQLVSKGMDQELERLTKNFLLLASGYEVHHKPPKTEITGSCEMRSREARYNKQNFSSRHTCNFSPTS